MASVASKEHPDLSEVSEEESSTEGTQNLSDTLPTTPQSNNNKGSASPSPSVYHTPELFLSPMAASIHADLARVRDLAKVREALTELDSAVHGEEDAYFAQLEATQEELETTKNQNLQLRQTLVSVEDLKTSNAALTESLEEARALINTLRTEAETKVNTLEATLQQCEEEIASMKQKLNGKTDTVEYTALAGRLQTKEVEFAMLQEEHTTVSKALADKTEELLKIQTDLNESLLGKDTELARIKAEMDSLQAEFDVVQTEKEEIELGHEEAKEKWKRLVITMKSEYDNFRASFDHLKESKKEMEESHAAEKEQFHKTTTELRTQNGGLTSSLDSLRIAKEVVDIEYQEAKQTWNNQKNDLAKQATDLTTELEELKVSKEQVDEQLQSLLSDMDGKVKEHLVDAERKLTSIDEECTSLKSEVSSLNLARQIANNEREELQTMYDNKVSESKALQAEIQKLEEAKESECKALQSEIEKMAVAKGETEKVSADLLAKLEAQSDNLDVLKQEHASIIKENVFADEKIAELEATIESLTAALEERKTELVASEAAKAESVRSIEESKEEIVQKLAALQFDYDCISTSLNTAQMSLSVAKDYHKEEKDALDKKIVKLNKMVETKTEALSMALTKYMKELKAKDKVEKKLAAAGEQLVELKQASEKQLAEAKEEEKKHLAELEESLEKAAAAKREEMQQAHLDEIKEAEQELIAQQEESNAIVEEIRQQHVDEMEVIRQTRIVEQHDAEEKRKTDLAEAEATLEETRKQHAAELVEAVAKLQAGLAESREKDAADLAALEEKHAAELEGVEKRVMALQDVITYKEKEHQEALTAFNQKVEEAVQYEAQQREVALQAQITAENKLFEMEKYVAKTEAEILSAKCQSDSLRECLQKADNGRQEAVAECTELTKKLDETTAALQTTSKEREQLQHSLVASEGAKDFAEKKLVNDTAEMKKQINALNKSVAKKIATITSLESRIEQLQDSIDITTSSETDTVQKMDHLRQLVTSREKELELVKSRCESLRSSLHKTEEELEKKVDHEKELSDLQHKVSENAILLAKKNSDVQVLNDRCEQLQVALKKAESLYLDGVENIRSETEKKQREALEEVQDRAYVLSQMLSQKEQEIVSMKSHYDSLSMPAPAADASDSDERKALANQIRFLDEMVASKDSELQLIKTRCDSLQASIEKMRETHEKQMTLMKEESKNQANAEAKDTEAKLHALNVEISKKQSMLKALHNGDQDFEVILDNGESNHYLKEEVDTLRTRCAELEFTLESVQDSAAAGADGHLTARCAALEESLMSMKQQYEEECERRKEAEQVFSTISEKPSREKAPSKYTRFRRNRISNPELAESNTAPKKSSKWLSIRARKNNDDSTARTFHPRDIGEYEQRDEDDSIVRSPRHSSPRRTRFAFGTSPEAILSQIPTHIKSNFMEVGFYKKRLTNTFLPVLCLGPFDVPPGPIRDEWLAKFNKSSKVLNMGVYFFGRDGQDEEAYGTIPWFSFVPYAKAVQRGLNVVPREITEKTENGVELSSEEKQIFDGIQQVIESADMEKDARSHPLKHLMESSETAAHVPKDVAVSVSSDEEPVTETRAVEVE